MRSRIYRIWALVSLGALASCHHSPRHPGGSIAPQLVAEGRLVRVASTDSTSDPGRFAIPVVVNGRTFQMGVDHGADITAFTDASIDRMHSLHWYDGAQRVDTLIRLADGRTQTDPSAEMTVTRGDTTFEYWGIPDPRSLDSMRIGTAREDTVLLPPIEYPAAWFAPLDGLLGLDMLSDFDLFFDMPKGTVQLYQRVPSQSDHRLPTWLPRGLDKGDCIRTRVDANPIDTTGMDAAVRQEILRLPARRVVERRAMRLPITINGHQIDGTFDSGASTTTINWAEAKALSITRTSRGASVVPVSEGRAIFTYWTGRSPRRSSSESTLESDSVVAVTGLNLHVGTKQLSYDTVFISDEEFRDFADYQSTPILNIGLRELRNYEIFLSYSTGFACLAETRGR